MMNEFKVQNNCRWRKKIITELDDNLSNLEEAYKSETLNDFLHLFHRQCHCAEETLLDEGGPLRNWLRLGMEKKTLDNYCVTDS